MGSSEGHCKLRYLVILFFPVITSTWALSSKFASSMLAPSFVFSAQGTACILTLLWSFFPWHLFHWTILFSFHSNSSILSFSPNFFLSLPPRCRNSILSPLLSVYLLFFGDLIKYSHLFSSTQLFCWIFKPMLDFFHLNFWASHQSPRIKVNIPSPPLETFPAESDGGFSGSKANKIQGVPVKKKNAKC